MHQDTFSRFHTIQKSQYRDTSFARHQNLPSPTFAVATDFMQALATAGTISITPYLGPAPCTPDFLQCSLSDLGFPWKAHACMTWENRRIYAGGTILGRWETGANKQWKNISTSVLPGKQF